MIVAPDGDYGHVLLTRWPISQSKLHDISVARREARAVIEVVVETPWGKLRVIAVHLGLSLRERHRQARQLATIAASSPLPLVMLGDFNDWLWHGSVQRALREMFPGRSRFRTFPSFLPLFRLDRIYVQPAAMLKSLYVDRTARAASDHLPIIADLDLSAAAHVGSAAVIANPERMECPENIAASSSFSIVRPPAWPTSAIFRSA